MRRSVVAAIATLAFAAPAHASLPALHATRGDSPGIFDAHGRQVLLRGVNVNQLGDYYRVDRSRPVTFPLRRRDLVRIRRLGFNVVRLILSWSKLEPQRGKIDAGYLLRIRQAVRWARRSNVYIVLDMHQDAWGKQAATAPGEICAPGFTPSIGWDGAPTWATFFDGLSRCHAQFREVSPAVARAFDNLYDDRSGIQTHLVRVWARLAREFAASPTVAGYDLLNEPHPGTRGPVAAQQLGAFYKRSIEAIRKAESARKGGLHHVVFFEPTVLYNLTGSPDTSPSPAFTNDRNLVFAPHMYAETLSTDQAYEATDAVAASYGAAFWVGEWGFFSQHARDDYASIRDFAAHEDAAAIGDTWWQWRQRCGDPHQFGDPSSKGRPIADGLYRYRCPGDHPLGIPPTTRRVLSRSYPRFAPGHIDTLRSDPDTGAFRVRGSDPSPRGSCRLRVWTPADRRGRPRFARTNVARVATRRVDGGWVTTGCAHGTYELRRMGVPAG